MLINKDELITALDKVECAIATTGIIPEMRNINYTQNKLVTYNGPMAAITAINLGEHDFSVPAKKFIKTVQTMPDKFNLTAEGTAVEFTAKGKKSKTNFGIVKHTGENAVIRGMQSIFTFLQENDDWNDLPADFVSGIKLCMFSAAKTTNLGTLSCLYFDKEYITSSDNMRISSYKMESAVDSFLLPANICSSITRINPTNYLFNDKQYMLMLEGENILLCIRLIDGDFPDYRSIAFDEKYDKEEELILPEELMEMVTAVGGVNADIQAAEQYVTITLKDSTITVETSHASGWGKEEVKLDYELDLDFSVSTGYPALMEILKYSGQIKLTKNNNRLVFGTDNYRHVLPLLQEKEGK